MAETKNVPSNGAPRQGSFNASGWKLFKILEEPFHLVSKKPSCIFALGSAEMGRLHHPHARSSTPHLLKFFALNLHGPDNDTTTIRKFLETMFDDTTPCHFLREDRRDNGEEMFALGFGNVEK